MQQFSVNNLNELTTESRSGTLTVAGTTTSVATNVTVNGSGATLYADNTFAMNGLALANGANTFTAIAQDSLGRRSTNTVSVNLPASTSCQYDGNGNLLSDGLRGFDYDEENQLIRVTVTNTWKSEFAYDAKMRRRVRTEFTWQNSAWLKTNEVRYIYDGNLVIQERDINNLPQVTYTRGTDLSGSLEGAGGIGGLLARTDCGLQQTVYYVTDGHGNVTCLMDKNQKVAARYAYDPFGNTLSKSGPLADANLYRFSSKELHQNSGLVYYLYRYYDPNLQRWLNRDSLGEKGVDLLCKSDSRVFADKVNSYRFVRNDAIDILDPDGRGWYDCCKALAELEAAKARLSLRVGQIEADVLGTGLDETHVKSLNQALQQVSKAYQNVAQHCGGPAALAAAAAAIQSALPYLEEMVVAI